MVEGFLLGGVVGGGAGCVACFCQRIGEVEYGVVTPKVATCAGCTAGGAISGAVVGPVFFNAGVGEWGKNKQ